MNRIIIAIDGLSGCGKSSPLKKAEDAYEIDTSNLIFEDQVRIIINKATGIISSKTNI